MGTSRNRGKPIALEVVSHWAFVASLIIAAWMIISTFQ